MLIIWGYLGESVNGQSVVYFEPLTMIFLWIKSGVWRCGWVIFEHWLKQMAWSYQLCRSSLPPSQPPSFSMSEDRHFSPSYWTGTRQSNILTKYFFKINKNTNKYRADFFFLLLFSCHQYFPVPIEEVKNNVKKVASVSLALKSCPPFFSGNTAIISIGLIYVAVCSCRNRNP